MNKDLIDIQRNSKATCVIVKEGDYAELKPRVCMKANVSDNFLFGAQALPFAEKLDEKSKKSELFYFLITNIDEVSTQKQNRFLELVKDREMRGYTIPDNCIMVFSVKDKESLKKVSKEIYQLSVVAF